MRITAPDVLVVGGGPAGSTVGGLLARRGWHVQLLDRARFPRVKPCGECMNPGAVRVLERLDLLGAVEALRPARIEGWDLHAGGATACGRFGPRVGPALAVSRDRLDLALLREAERRGVEVEEGVHVVDADPAAGGRPPSVTIRDRDGRARVRPARCVVGADGLRSVVARALGAHRRRPRLRKLSLTCRLIGPGPPAGRGHLFLSDHGTFGLAPVGMLDDGAPLWNGTLVVRANEEGRAAAADPCGFFRATAAGLVGASFPLPPVAEGPWASGPFDWPTRRVVDDGIVLVGDAAGYYDPLTGEGIFRALRSAELAAGVIDRALRRGRVWNDALAPYDRSVRRSFRPQRRIQRLIEGVIGRPRLRSRAIRILARSPGATDALIRVTGDARAPVSLLHPRVLGSLLTLPPASPPRSRHAHR